MSKDQATKMVSVKLEKSVIAKADYLANRAEIARQRLLTNLLNVGSEEALENPFIFQVGTLITELKNKVVKAKSQDDTEDKLDIIPLKISTDCNDRIGVIASKWLSTRHDVMRKIIINGIDGLLTAESLGLLPAMIKARDIALVFQKLCKKGQDTYKEMLEEDQFKG